MAAVDYNGYLINMKHKYAPLKVMYVIITQHRCLEYGQFNKKVSTHKVGLSSLHQNFYKIGESTMQYTSP